MPPASIPLTLEPINVSLSIPVFLAAPSGDLRRAFIVEKNGVIKILDLNARQLLPIPFLDLTGLIATDGEQGLLGLAFHPNFAQNGCFYVYVSNAGGDSEIRRYKVSSNPDVADPASEMTVITVSQQMPDGSRFSNHKAGWLGFGPDGFLYAALGDGGSGGDPFNKARDLNSLLGKMLRIDVNADADDFPEDATRNYAIPSTNPYVGVPGADEIWTYGLRNPFRNSFDRGTGDFYIADVGQGRQEEVNVATLSSGGGAGVNFGWDVMEGSLCFEPFSGCSMTGLVGPILEYDHSGIGGCSITGGYVYRGSAIPGLQGTYFYGDFCMGFVRSFRFAGGAATEQFNWAALAPGGNITSFGEDASGELYILTSAGGLFRIVQ
jgi:glucose/arabinose dehydrogenase